ncbi:aminopeptidase P family protein [Simiduia sp. 21SJ11W-1]|uniref:aminopeptidase P family protein n=1 Tax=Simiduia sp. 21SJ11W-1 TaxID=2909669 RepID=UPI0020A0EB89|nr:aminopeptidase P family protein [Simiduia sp. 21SJ11W-1]UTA49083.1 aminopeptidase P family protein [Simiduia sp. 21SJ11W-1]
MPQQATKTAEIQARLTAVRAHMASAGVAAYIQPRADEYLGEYVPACNERLLWLSGYTGSAGFVVVLADSAGIFVDGRYTIQVRSQAPAECYSYHSMSDSLAEWLAERLPAGAKIGYDPRLHTLAWAQTTEKALKPARLTLAPLATNPVDASWADRPAAPATPLRLFPHSSAGATSTEKRKRVGGLITKAGADVALITACDSIAWLLNIRGDDIPYLPVVLGTALLYADGQMTFFVDPAKRIDSLAEHVGEGVRFEPETALEGALAKLGGQRLLADPAESNAWCQQQAQQAGAELIAGMDPVALPKAAKNAAELEGIRQAHLRDGAAVCRFLAWLDREVAAGRFYDEGQLADKLLWFRQQLPEFLDLSFDTISAAGGNAAMCHYNHMNGTPAMLPNNSIYLVDSGAQYPDGTTDITRTVAIGQVTDDMRRMVTLVLKGHIALDQARFPKGTSGHQLDVLARQYLWAAGFDFDHGTGHGVGHYLSVHEGPQRISKGPNAVALLPGMVCSNEPGYYRDHAFGIRLENLVAVRPCEALAGAEREIYEFEALTLVPMDTRLMDTSLMSRAEIDWVNRYHRRVFDAMAPQLEGEDLHWLTQATQPIGA